MKLPTLCAIFKTYFEYPEKVIEDEQLSLAAKGLFGCILYLCKKYKSRTIPINEAFMLNPNMGMEKLLWARVELENNNYIQIYEYSLEE
ncbi:MAG: hypothetical protein ACOC56_06405 [Atribacterota bacterium]